MDQTHEYSFQKQRALSLSQFIKSQFLKRVITKLILSVSMFSILFSHPTLHSCLHYVNFYFSNLPMKLFSHTLDKNCAFLLCNGLLVFLVKYSGLFSSSSSSSKYNLRDHESFKNYEDDSQSQVMIETADQLPLLEKEAEVESTETQQNGMEGTENSEDKSQEATETETEKHIEKIQEEQEEEESKDVLEENEETAEGSFFIAEAETREEIEEGEEEGEEEEEGNGMLSTEELNKKFDDFIWKMKEELRIEARQQLVMV